jgi:predicted kinase
MKTVATLFLICGLPGSGKTTFAKKLESSQHALRLSPDAWISKILANTGTPSERDRLRPAIEAVQWDVAQRVLALGKDVILEWGFWSHAERQYWRQEAEKLGVRVEIHYFDVPLDELWQRLSKRNEQLPPDTFVVSKENLELWYHLFEAPTADEDVIIHT